jgi:hypothetical protein
LNILLLRAAAAAETLLTVPLVAVALEDFATVL